MIGFLKNLAHVAKQSVASFARRAVGLVTLARARAGLALINTSVRLDAVADSVARLGVSRPLVAFAVLPAVWVIRASASGLGLVSLLLAMLSIHSWKDWLWTFWTAFSLVGVVELVKAGLSRAVSPYLSGPLAPAVLALAAVLVTFKLSQWVLSLLAYAKHAYRLHLIRRALQNAPEPLTEEPLEAEQFGASETLVAAAVPSEPAIVAAPDASAVVTVEDGVIQSQSGSVQLPKPNGHRERMRDREHTREVEGRRAVLLQGLPKAGLQGS